MSPCRRKASSPTRHVPFSYIVLVLTVIIVVAVLSAATDTVAVGSVARERQRVLQTGDRGTHVQPSGDETAGGHQQLLSGAVHGYRQ